MLPEHFPPTDNENGVDEDYEVGGVPVKLGGKIRLGYTCASPFGLGRTDQNRTPRFCYRVNEGEWIRLPLIEAVSTEKTGPFDPRTGAFANSGYMDQVAYHAIPSPDPNRMGRLEGGGRFDFLTKAIRGLKVGDRLEFYLDVYDQNPEPNREPGHSETRIKAVVTPPELEAWVQQTLQEESRIRQLEGRQRGIFSVVEGSGDEPSEPTPSVVVPVTPPKPLGPQPTTTFVRTWQLLGPFQKVAQSGHDTVFLPEQEAVNLNASYDGQAGKVSWKLHDSNSNYIDLRGYFHNSDVWAVAYGACWVHTPRARKVRLAVGSDDGIKIWLNRRLILRRKVTRSATPGDDRELIDLPAGWSEFLVKVDNDAGNLWGFYFELRDPETDRQVSDLQFRTTKPAGGTPAVAETPALRSWQLLGPFPNPEERGRDIAYPPETDNAQRTTFTGKDSETVRFPRNGPRVVVDKATYGVPGDPKRTARCPQTGAAAGGYGSLRVRRRTPVAGRRSGPRHGEDGGHRIPPGGGGQPVARIRRVEGENPLEAARKRHGHHRPGEILQAQ